MTVCFNYLGLVDIALTHLSYVRYVLEILICAFDQIVWVNIIAIGNRSTILAIFKISHTVESLVAPDKPSEPVSPDTVAQGDNAEAATPETKIEENKPFSLTAVEEKEDPKYLIKVNGAAGHMFTEALNRVLALEEMTTTLLPAYIETMEGEAERLYPKHKVIHVSTVDGSDIDIGDVLEIQKDVVDHQEDDYVIAVESADFSKSRNMRRYSILQGLTGNKHVAFEYDIGKAALRVGRLICSQK